MASNRKAYRINSDSDKKLSPYNTKDSKYSLASVKRRVKQIATDLGYPLAARIAIDKAKSEEEIDRIMRSARKGEYNE